MPAELTSGHPAAVESTAVESSMVAAAETATSESPVVTATGEAAPHVAPAHMTTTRVAATVATSTAVTASMATPSTTMPPLDRSGVRKAQKDGRSQRRSNGKNADIHTPSPSESESCAAHRRNFIFKYTET